MPRLPRRQHHLLKRHKLLLRPRQPRLLVPHVDLDRLGPVHVPDVADAHDDLDGAAGGEDALLELGPAVLEGRVGEAVAEGEERGDVAALEVPVADVDALAVGYL